MLVYSLGVVSVISAEEIQNEEVVDIEAQDALITDDKIETIFSLGIMERTTDEYMHLEGKVSRMAFAEWIFKILNYDRKDEDFEASAQYFEDIAVHHYGAGIIQELASRGIISGYEDKTFRPENELTYQEAAIIIVRALGQAIHADLTGKSLYAYAREVGVLEDIKFGVEDNLTRGDAARMLYNMMYINVPGGAFSSQTVSSTKEGRKFIHAVMGLDYVDGVLDAIGGVSLYNNSVSDSIVSVNGFTYSTEAEYDYEHLGYFVRAYIDNNNNENLICYSVKKTEAIEISSGDIISYSNNVYKFRNENGKEKRESIETDFDFVYNKYYCQDITKMVPAYGSIKLIDNDRNGKFDVVIVTEMQSLVVDKVIGENEIVFKNQENGSNISINLADYDLISIYTAEGYETKKSAIRQGIVLTIIKNDKGVIDIYVSDKTVTGYITANEIGDDGRYVQVGEDTYYLTSDCYLDSWSGNLGIDVLLRFDSLGKVASIESNYVAGWQYGYILKVYKINDEFGEYIQLKMVNQDGVIVKVPVREKAIINAVTVKGMDNQYSTIMNLYNNFAMESTAEGVTSHTKELATTHLMKYQTNEDGIITKIDTPHRRSIFTADRFSLDSNDSFMIRCKGNMYYEPRQKQLRAAYQSYIDLAGEIFVNGNTKIFVIPDEENTNPEEEDYRVTNLQGVGFNPNGQFVYASGYNSDNSSLVCDVVVLRYGTAAATDSNLMIYKKSRQKMDDDNEVRTVINGFVNGNIVEYFMSEKGQAVDVNNLSSGDVILYRLANGEIKIENIIYSNNSRLGILNNSSAYAPNSSETYFNASFRVVKGTPVRADNGYIYIDFADDTMLDEILSISSLDVYDANAEEEFYSVNPRNIKTTQSHGQYADTIFLCTKNGQNISAVVVRN